MEVETRLTQPSVAVKLALRAGANRKRAQQQIKRFANGIGVTVRAEVAVALLLFAPDHHGSRPLVGQGDRQERVALVVSVTHVVARLMALDQRVLQHERFNFVGDLDPLNRVSF